MHLGEAMSRLKQLQKRRIMTRGQKQEYVRLVRVIMTMSSGKVRNYYKRLIS